MRLLLLALLQDSGEAARFEKLLAEAKGIRVSFRGELRDAERTAAWSGSLRQSGARYVLTIAHNLYGEDRVETLRSDGKRTQLVVRDRVQERKTGDSAPLLHRTALARTGFFLESRPLRDALEGRAITDDVFRLSAPAVARDGDALRIDRELEYGSEKWTVSLVVDARTLAPRSRTGVSGETRWQEWYGDFSTDAIPDREFELE